MHFSMTGSFCRIFCGCFLPSFLWLGFPHLAAVFRVRFLAQWLCQALSPNSLLMCSAIMCVGVLACSPSATPQLIVRADPDTDKVSRFPLNDFRALQASPSMEDAVFLYSGFKQLF
ncbi:unnamed protein product [Polarella glacialis]|uniref:Uncharacterized protein n=1 Tax=Polarella glacialis TaxID=89957 RepID=A0A813J4P2_POLGL|nr:unnamed protein product [Polarella glacialis]CAE8667994.1 unnamed protein product [Polarella glacialis]